MTSGREIRVLHLVDDAQSGGGIQTYLRVIDAAAQAAGLRWTYAGIRRSPGEVDGVVLLESIEQVADLARTSETDVIHSHRLVVADLSRRTGLPVVRTVHGHHPYCPSGSKFFSRQHQPCHRKAGLLPCAAGLLVDRCGSLRPPVLRPALDRYRAEGRSDASLLIAMSRFVERRLVESGRFDVPIVRLKLPVPRPDAPPTTSPDASTVAVVARLTPAKGVDWLLESLALTRGSVQLAVLGDGPDRERLEARARQLGIDQRVTFLGWVTPERVREIMRQSAAVVVPSLWQEPAGYVALEAFAEARPVIASDVGGLPDVVRQEVTGVLVRPGDRAEMADALDALTSDPDRAARLGRAGRECVEREHAAADHVQALTEVYEGVVRP